MKKYFIIVPILFMLTAKSQIPCDRLPDSAQLFNQLSERPVFNISAKEFSENCNVTLRIKQRILDVLKWKWTEDELDRYLLKVIDTSDLKKLSNGDTAKHDSILNKRKKQILALQPESLFKVDGGLTLLPAKLYMREAIPILEEALSDPLHYRIGFVQLALARLGNKQLQRLIISQCTNNSTLHDREWLLDADNKIKKLMFICTQESICAMAGFMDTSKIYSLSADGGPMIKSITEGIWFLSRIIENEDFRAKYDWAWIYNAFEINNEVILYCKKWLLENKGNYKLNNRFVLY